MSKTSTEEERRTEESRRVRGNGVPLVLAIQLVGSSHTGFISLPLYQTYLRRTGGICAPESARGRQT
jgi:hypothetical protein